MRRGAGHRAQGYGGYSYGQPADTKSPPGYNYVDTYGSGSYSAY